MGVLSRWRPARGADRLVNAPDAPAAAGPEIIRASTLAATPEWAKLPPPAPLLPPVPWVVSQHFDDSLVSWQPPELFIAPLGHSISASAPAGVVEGLAILSPAPLVQPVVASSPAAASNTPLPLVVPTPVEPVMAEGEGDDGWSWVASRPVSPALQSGDLTEVPPSSIPPAGMRPSPPPGQPLPVAVAPASRPAPSQPAVRAADGDQPVAAQIPPPPAGGTIAPGLSTGLVGAAPLAAIAEPLVTAQLSAAPRNPLLHASTPPGMPLVQLPTALLPGGSPPRPPVVASLLTPPASPGSSEPPARPLTPAAGAIQGTSTPPNDAAGLIGERALTGESPALAGLLPDSGPGAAGPQSRAGLPVAPLVDEPPAPGGLPLAPLVGEQPAPIPSGADAGPGPTGPLSPAPRPADPSVAPLIGDTIPLTARPPTTEPGRAGPVGPGPVDQPLAPAGVPSAPRAPRSGGLGAPMTSLPSSATPFDLTKMSPAARRRTTQSLMRGHLGAPARPGGDPGAPAGPSLFDSATEEATRSSVAPATNPETRLPLVALESLGSPSSGVEPVDLPPAAPWVAPLVSMTPWLPGEVTRTGGPDTRPVRTGRVEGMAVRSEIGRRHGVDLSGVPVDRTTAGAAQAQRMGARGYTSGSAVVIPAEVGSLDVGPGRALLAHELTHVAQGARYQGIMPAEHTPAGQRLEAEALLAEMAFAPAPAVGTVPSLAPGSTGLPGRGPAPGGTPALAGRTRSGGAGMAPVLPLAPATATKGFDQTDLVAALQQLSQPATTSSSSPAPTVTTLAPGGAPGPTLGMAAAGGVQLAKEPAPAPAPTPEPPSQGGDDGGSLFAERPSDADLSKLVRWLYPLISFRMRGELRENREQAGLLTDSYGR